MRVERSAASVPERLADFVFGVGDAQGFGFPNEMLDGGGGVDESLAAASGSPPSGVSVDALQRRLEIPEVVGTVDGCDVEVKRRGGDQVDQPSGVVVGADRVGGVCVAGTGELERVVDFLCRDVEARCQALLDEPGFGDAWFDDDPPAPVRNRVDGPEVLGRLG